MTLSSTDSDLPAQTLTYSLIAGPTGLTVSPSGDVAWTPTEAQGPSTNAVTVHVSDGVVNVDQTFQVIGTEINVAPVLAAVPDQTIATLTPLVLALSATDIDFPVQGLTCGLVSGPAGLTMSANGAVAWTPAEAQGSSTNTVTVRVSDGVEWTECTFQVRVARPDDFTLRIGSFNPDTGRLELRWSTQPGQRFQVEYQAGLSSAAWVPLGDAITATDTLESFTVTTSEGSLRLFRVVRLP